MGKFQLKNPFTREKPGDPNSYKGGIQHKRHCTDILFLLLFLVFWIGMIAIAVLAIKAGNPLKLIEPTDYMSQMCGYPKGAALNPLNKNEYDLTDSQYLWFPIDFRQDISLEKLIQIKDMGICVPECPRGIDFSVNADWETLIGISLGDGGVVCDYPYRGSAISDSQRAAWALENVQTGGAGKCFVNLFSTEPVLKRCIPSVVNKTINEMTVQYLKVAIFATDFLGKAVAEVTAGWKVIAISCLVSVVLCFAWVLFLRLFVGIIAWITILLVFLVLALAAGYCLYVGIRRLIDYKDDPTITSEMDTIAKVYVGVGAAFVVADFIYLCIILWLIRRIIIAIEIIKESSKALMRMPEMIFVPPVVFAAAVLITIYYLIVAAYIQSSEKFDEIPYDKLTELSQYVGVDVNATNYQIPQDDRLIQLLHFYHLFGYFWTLAFFLAIGYTSIAGAVSSWYFSKPGDKKTPPKWAVPMATWRVIRYHLGSLALGAMIVAIVQIIRLIFRKLEQKFNKTNSKEIKYVTRAIHVLLACLEKIIKFINKNAYIMIAIHGSNFCNSAQRAFKLILTNILRVGAVNLLGTFVLFLGKVFISCFAGILCFVLIDQVAPRIPIIGGIDIGGFLIQDITFTPVPVAIAVLISFVISTIFMDVYETSIDTVLLCFCEDVDVNDGDARPYYMPNSLKRMLDKRTPPVTQTPIRLEAIKVKSKQ